jgi:hypothetical protein
VNLTPQGRRLLSLLYVAAALIVLDQTLDLFSALYPFRTDLPNWRVGAFGVTLARLEYLALADALAVATAFYLEHRKVLIGLAAAHLVVGVGILAGLGLFTLDTLQIRRLMQPERVRRLDIAALRTLALGGSAALACFILTITVWKSRQRPAKEAKREAILVSSARGQAQ